MLIFVRVGEPKILIDDSSSNLIFEFRRINETSHEIHNEINQINNEKTKITLDEYGIFSITNIIQESLEILETDVQSASDFSHNMLRNPYLTNYTISLTTFFIGFMIFGLSIASLIKKSPNLQKMVYFISGLGLSYLIYVMGMYFSNYSILHDICNSLIKINKRDYIPEKGMGIIKYLGCSQENIFFQ